MFISDIILVLIIIARQLILWVVFFMQKNLAAKEVDALG